LTEIEDQLNVTGSLSDPALDLPSFFFILLGKSLDTFSFEFDVEGIFGVHKHVHKGVSKGEELKIT
jgi:hypothetical protein